ncbi:fumarylacetoacetate hydrolase family protein [Epibacterium ulvae]|uniref:fumarylacetoacetate hydrolase family protein n=1 Tax=Epibacterium ulvae TaxID=1156985 RepID=UPI002493C994|nr:fumarylacetoacetate hydrolase family protein [Epibacterium ulvae]
MSTQKYIFPPAPPVSLPITNTDARFPVRRIYCVGRNYAAHAIEMGHDPEQEPPFFFQKPADTILQPHQDFLYPSQSADVHFELEQVIALSTGGQNIPIETALDHIFAYGVGLDMTRRDLQAAAKAKGRPWSTGKGFDHSAPMSALCPVAQIGHPTSGAVTLKVNGEVRQNGDLAQMLWKPQEIITHLSQLFTLFPGDLIMTGTPAGVGAIERGDLMEGQIAGITDIRVAVV